MTYSSTAYSFNSIQPIPQASLTSENEVQETGGASGGRSWWRWQDVGPDNRPSRAASYSGWEQSFDNIAAAVAEHRPDGIMGFSQGATATALYLADATLRANAGTPAAADGTEAPQKEHQVAAPLPRFAIIISGFLPRDEAYASKIREAKTCVPSLFVLGTQDQLVPEQRTRDLVAAFDETSTAVFVHPGAHLVPTCSGDNKAAMVDFLDQFKPLAQQSEARVASGKRKQKPSSSQQPNARQGLEAEAEQSVASQ